MMGGTLLSLLKGGDVGDAVVDGGDGGDVDVVVVAVVDGGDVDGVERAPVGYAWGRGGSGPHVHPSAEPIGHLNCHHHHRSHHLPIPCRHHRTHYL